MTRLSAIGLTGLLLSSALSAQSQPPTHHERAAALAGCYRMDWLTDPAIQRRLPSVLRLMTSSAPRRHDMPLAFGATALLDSTTWQVRWAPVWDDSLVIVFGIKPEDLDWRIMLGPKTTVGSLRGRVVHYAQLPGPVDSSTIDVDGVPIPIGPVFYPIWSAEVHATPAVCP